MNEITEIFPAYEEYLQPARFKCAWGGRGSAKTRTFVSILTNNVLYYGWRVVCFREIQESIAESVYQEFVEEIERRDLGEYFNILKTHIECVRNGGVIKFSGLKASAKRLDSQKLKGFSNFDAAWLEEANPVSEESWRALIPTMRKPGSEIWISFNPENPLEETYKRFVTERIYPDYQNGKRYCISKRINYDDNPRLPQELIDDIELMRANDPELFRHVYGGEPVANSDLSIIKPAWIEAALDAHIKLDIHITGGKLGGFDVSDEGPDANAFIWRHGILLSGIEEWKDNDPNSAARHVFRESVRLGLQSVEFDDIGVGAGAKGALREEIAALDHRTRSRMPTFTGFTASAAVRNPSTEYMPGKKNEDMFLNLKAQAWWMLADRFRNTYNAVRGEPYDAEKLIAIKSDLPYVNKLCAELAQPRRQYLNGKVKVESKDDMKKRGVMSPNLADSCVMAYASDIGGFDISSLI
jgi:phage terminase large subunit